MNQGISEWAYHPANYRTDYPVTREPDATERMEKFKLQKFKTRQVPDKLKEKYKSVIDTYRYWKVQARIVRDLLSGSEQEDTKH